VIRVCSFRFPVCGAPTRAARSNGLGYGKPSSTLPVECKIQGFKAEHLPPRTTRPRVLGSKQSSAAPRWYRHRHHPLRNHPRQSRLASPQCGSCQGGKSRGVGVQSWVWARVCNELSHRTEANRPGFRVHGAGCMVRGSGFGVSSGMHLVMISNRRTCVPRFNCDATDESSRSQHTKVEHSGHLAVPNPLIFRIDTSVSC
jgi:hypothetical protein